jgi:hypothetical protein
MKLSKKINLFEDFKSEISNSGTKTNQVQVNTTKAEPTAEVKSEMLKDVDSILNNLEVLSAQIGEARESLYDFIDECHGILTEEMAKETPDQSAIDTILEAYLELFESLENEEAEVNEAGGEAAKKMGKGLWRFVYWAPLARKAQQKVNKVKLNQKALDLAADEAPNKEQREKLELRATRMTDKVKQLQAAVDDRFGDKGNYVKGVIQRQKIQGQLDIIKTETGMSDDPDEQTTLKAKAQALQKRYKEEEEALKAMEPSDEDKKKAADELKAQQDAEAKLKAKRDAERDAAQAKAGETPAADKPEGEKPASETPAADKPEGEKPASETPAADKPEGEKPASETPAADKPEGEKPASETPAADKPEGETPAADKPNRPESGKNSKDDMIKRYQELLAKTEDADKKSKIQAKIDKLQAESVEMFDNAEFISILESELAEFSREIIAESFGFQTSTIADKFRKLL